MLTLQMSLIMCTVGLAAHGGAACRWLGCAWALFVAKSFEMWMNMYISVVSRRVTRQMALARSRARAMRWKAPHLHAPTHMGEAG